MDLLIFPVDVVSCLFRVMDQTVVPVLGPSSAAHECQRAAVHWVREYVLYFQNSIYWV